MILQTLQAIKSAETGSKQRINAAKEEAVGMVGRAKSEAEKLLAEKAKEVRLQAEKAREGAANEAREECRLIADEWEKRIQELSVEAHKNLEKAKEFIVRSLLG